MHKEEYLKRRITKSEYDKKYQEHRDKIADIDAQLKLLQDAEDNYYLSIDYVLNLSHRAGELFNSSKIDEKRVLIKHVLQNLRLEGGSV